ncbi:MAG: hypothetical protein K8R92_09005 [Planctomycetes bacterium]|nr:hypothetical protein [Planctomycetota bacterium]
MQRQKRNELLEKLYMLQLATPLDHEAIRRASQDYREMAAIANTSGQFLKQLQEDGLML